MLADRYGLALSTTSQPARDAYVAACDGILAGIAGVGNHLNETIVAAPAFALAHAALARGRFVEADVKAACLKAERPGDARKLIARRVDRRAPVNVAGFGPA